MIIMDLKVDNFYAFKNFHMNMSYPKKIVDSYIDGEFLEERENFRYKKVNIIMGANATGKTSIGKMIMDALNFIKHKEGASILDEVGDERRLASITMDFVAKSHKLYRVDIRVFPKTKEDNQKIKVCVRLVGINKRDNYETCAKRLDELPLCLEEDFAKELEKIEKIGWLFVYSSDSSDGVVECSEDAMFPTILDYTMRALDPTIKRVEKLNEVKNSYVVRMEQQDLIIQDGEVIKNNILSSGTKSGIEIANMLTGIRGGEYGFYYCDEVFSYVHSDVEKAFLSIMINQLRAGHQLFFTTHNSDILDMQLPKHAFIFLKKDVYDEEEPIKCIDASKYLKRNTDSLRNAVENDLFSTSPNLELIYEIENL